MSLEPGEHGLGELRELRERPRRKLFRYPCAKPPVGQTEVADGKVRFTAPNGENYEVDLVKMRQRNWQEVSRRSWVFHLLPGDTWGGIFQKVKELYMPVKRWIVPIFDVLRSWRDD